MIRLLMFVTLAAASVSFGQQLITATRSLMAGEMRLATLNPYATAAQQNEQIAAAMGQINEAHTGAQAPQP